MLENPLFWVAVSFATFIAIAIYLKLHTKLIDALDSRTVKIRTELDAARALREEAEAILASYKQKQAEYLSEAEHMLAKARSDADALRAQAELELKTALDTRMKAALERIAQEETRAIEDVRAHVVDVSLAAARALIVQHIETVPQQELLKLALADIDRKIH